MSFDRLISAVSKAMAEPSEDDILLDMMAADLRRLGQTASERDAIRALTHVGYRMGDVVLLAEQALFRARQRADADTLRKATARQADPRQRSSR